VIEDKAAEHFPHAHRAAHDPVLLGFFGDWQRTGVRLSRLNPIQQLVAKAMAARLRLLIGTVFPSAVGSDERESA